MQSVVVTVHNAFFAGDEGFDYHTSEAIDKDGKKSLFKIFGYIKVRDGKISHYEDITLQLSGKEAMTLATSISAAPQN